MYDETPRHLIVPEDNHYYTKTHEWISLDEKNMITVGISYYVQDNLGDIVSWKLPSAGQFFERSAPFGLIESNKSVSDLYMPVSGEVVGVNESLTASLISDHPMDKGWLIKVEISRESELALLLDPASYKAWIKKLIKDVE